MHCKLAVTYSICATAHCSLHCRQSLFVRSRVTVAIEGHPTCHARGERLFQLTRSDKDILYSACNFYNELKYLMINAAERNLRSAHDDALGKNWSGVG
jgi:hypothetical protein